MAIDLLAAPFGGRRNFMNALKLSVYAYTPVWLAGIFLLMPGLRFLTILSLYAGYLLWTGLPVLLDVPRARVPAFVAAILVIAVALTLLLALATSFVFSLRG
jgi:hypothetical protein